MADVAITEFTDPACPWAFSAEPFKLRLRWLYGDRIDWTPRMVVLSERPEDYSSKGMTPEKLAGGAGKIADKFGMPIDSTVRPRLVISGQACRAVVAARVHAPDATEALLRALRVRNFRNEFFDEPDVLAAAGDDAGLNWDDLSAWMETDEVAEAFDADKHAARHPTAAARVLDARLADWEGGRRYTCPSYEITVGDQLVSIPGFQPFAAYDVVFANLLPDVARRPAPAGVTEVLEWAGMPLATQEIAEVCELSRDEAREQLRTVATQQPSGADAYWTLG